MPSPPNARLSNANTHDHSDGRMSKSWAQRALAFIDTQYDSSAGGYRSVPGGSVTLYGSVYGLLTRHYLGEKVHLPAKLRQFLVGCQDPATGYFIGPEIREWTVPPGAKHDRQHLLLHLACAVLPTTQEFGVSLAYPLRFAHPFCDSLYLQEWLDARDMKDAWFEGNNLLFVGQLLVYLRDIEGYHGANQALEQWFRWLDDTVDGETGLWGTQMERCSTFIAMCGGYHQLLVYYHEGRPIPSPKPLVNTVLGLQHPDGGFSPSGGGGACEDVDAIDILVNAYKRFAYRRPEIRAALRRAADSILRLQNDDGGFPYKVGIVQDHMGIPATRAAANVSTTFATWFRVHTLALLAEVLTDDIRLRGPLRFSRCLSMGWHTPWGREGHPVSLFDRLREIPPTLGLQARGLRRRLRRLISS